MKLPQYNATWPEAWKIRYEYDVQELSNETETTGYARLYRVRAKLVEKSLQRFAASGSKLLDVAAGQGNFSLRAAARGHRVCWNDIDHSLIDYVRLKDDKQALEFRPGNFLELGVIAEYETVLALEVIEHVAHPDKFLAALAAALQPGGVLVLTTPNGEFLRNTLPSFSQCKDPEVFEAAQFQPNADGHIFLLTSKELDQLGMQVGLKRIDTKYFGTPVVSGFCGLHRVQGIISDKLRTAIESLLLSLSGRRLAYGMLKVFRKE